MGPWIADHAAQGGENKNRDVVAVVDFCDRIDAGHQPGGPHDGERRNTAEVRARAQTHRRFLAIDWHMLKAVVLVNGMNQRRDPIIGKAGHKFNPAPHQLINDQFRRFVLFIAQARLRLFT